MNEGEHIPQAIVICTNSNASNSGNDVEGGRRERAKAWRDRILEERERIMHMVPEKMSTEQLRAHSDQILGLAMNVIKENLTRPDPDPEDFPINPETFTRDGYHKEQMRVDMLKMSSERNAVNLQRIVAQREQADKDEEDTGAYIDDEYIIKPQIGAPKRDSRPSVEDIDDGEDIDE